MRNGQSDRQNLLLIFLEAKHVPVERHRVKWAALTELAHALGISLYGSFFTALRKELSFAQDRSGKYFSQGNLITEENLRHVRIRSLCSFVV